MFPCVCSVIISTIDTSCNDALRMGKETGGGEGKKRKKKESQVVLGDIAIVHRHHPGQIAPAHGKGERSACRILLVVKDLCE